MPLMRGAIPSPRNVVFGLIPHRVTGPYPSRFGLIPRQLDAWGNHDYGDCVSAEEAFAKAAYSQQYGAGTELFIPSQTLISWARKHNYLNGATLTDVMDDMIRDGIVVDGKTYTDGPYRSVDWTNDDVLSSAIYQGPVKIAVAADHIANSYKESNGWFGTGWRKDNNIDHCVSLGGFGSMQDLASMLGVGVPGGVNPGDRGYLLFTWGSIGVVDRQSMINVTAEAYLRTPTTPQTPAPDPTPAPVPNPPGPVPIPGQAPPPVVFTFGVYQITIAATVINPVPPAPTA